MQRGEGGGVARQGSARCKSSHLHCEQPLAPLKTFPPPSFVCLPVGLVFSATPGSAGPAALFTHSPLHWRVCEDSPLHNVLLYSTFPRILGLFSREEKILLGLGLTVAQICSAPLLRIVPWTPTITNLSSLCPVLPNSSSHVWGWGWG